MKKSVALIIAVFAAWGALAQEPYRCKKPDGSFVIQDSPCKLSLGQPPAARPAAMISFAVPFRALHQHLGGFIDMFNLVGLQH